MSALGKRHHGEDVPGKRRQPTTPVGKNSPALESPARLHDSNSCPNCIAKRKVERLSNLSSVRAAPAAQAAMPKQEAFSQRTVSPRLSGELVLRIGAAVSKIKYIGNGWSEGESNGFRGRFPCFATALAFDLKSEVDTQNPFAEYEYATRLLKGTPNVPPDRPQALRLFELSAKQGYVLAQEAIAKIRLRGPQQERNATEGLNQYLAAAQQGSPLAQHKLAIFLRKGKEGVPKNVQVSEAWARKAAASGYVKAQHFLAEAYRKNRFLVPPEHSGQGKNYCVQWYKLAAEQNYLPAMIRYAHCLQLMESNEEAHEWWKRASVLGNIEAHYETALYLERMLPLSTNDLRECVRLYKLAAEKGHAPSKNALGYLYKRGTSLTPQDLNVAASYFVAAASGGDPMACLNVASCYEHGEGLTQSTTHAVFWRVKAQELQSSPSKKRS